jgi:hypothetical protein
MVIPKDNGICPACNKPANKQILFEIDHSVTNYPITKLWTPRIIAITSILFSIMGGLVLAIINWQRMQKVDRIIYYTILGFIITLIFALGLLFLPKSIIYLVSLLLNGLIIFNIYKIMKIDIQEYKIVTSNIQNENWITAIILGIGIYISYIAIITLIIVIAKTILFKFGITTQI